MIMYKILTSPWVILLGAVTLALLAILLAGPGQVAGEWEWWV